MDFKTEFRAYLNESMIDAVKEKFKGFLEELEKLPGKFEYKVTINGVDVFKGKENLVSIPKKEADQIDKWIKLVKEADKIEHKKPEIGDFNSALRLTKK